MAGVKISNLTPFNAATASKNNDLMPVVNQGAASDATKTQKPTIYEWLSAYMPNGLYVPGGFALGLQNVGSFDDNYLSPLCLSVDYVGVETALTIGSTNDPISRLDIRGAGALDTTRNVRFTDSVGNVLFEVLNGGTVKFGTSGQAQFNSSGIGKWNRWEATGGFGGNYFLWGGGGGDDFRLAFGNTQNAQFGFNSYVLGDITPQASSLLTLTSTTKGFLPPRMTTAQKNAIATPTGGMVVYDTTLGKLCVYGAAAWETITSV